MEYIDYVIKAAIGFVVKCILDVFFKDALEGLLKNVKEKIKEAASEAREKAPVYAARVRILARYFRFFLVRRVEEINRIPATILINAVAIGLWICDSFGLDITNVSNEVCIICLMLMIGGYLLVSPKQQNNKA